MSTFTFSPPTAFIDPNMIDTDGLIPAAREYISGIRLRRGFRVGQPIRAKDEDGNSYAGTIARVERHLLYLDITVRDAAWNVARSTYLDLVPVRFDPLPGRPIPLRQAQADSSNVEPALA